MKDFKQTTKMKAQGSHYCGGSKVKKYADGGDVTEGQNANIGDDVRARAMAAMAKRDQDTGGDLPSATPAPKKAATKLYPPDMTIEEADRQNTEYENKRESQRLARRYPVKKTPAQTIRDESEIAARPTLETKGAKLLKDSGIKIGYKTGGKVKRGAKK